MNKFGQQHETFDLKKKYFLHLKPMIKMKKKTIFVAKKIFII